MPKKKSAIDHLNSGRVPHIVHMIPRGAPGYAEAKGGAMVVSSPAEVDALIRRLKLGEVITLDDLRAALARRHQVAVACPVSTAIFANMSARATEERRALGVPPEELRPRCCRQKVSAPRRLASNWLSMTTKRADLIAILRMTDRPKGEGRQPIGT